MACTTKDSKSDQISTECKEEGNIEFQKGHFKRALLLYNDALRYAETNECLALAYANRSAVYLELKKYDECLQNIQWARENYYPADKIQKLNEREEKCKELKAAQVIDPEEDPWNFLKLSHPPNPKIPFIVDCLEMQETEKYGRGIYATRDIAVGDIISIEESFIHTRLGDEYIHTKNIFSCSTCLRTNMLNHIPCPTTAFHLFCSAKCREMFLVKPKNNQTKVCLSIIEKFGSREKLLEFLESIPDITALNYSVFDFDWSNPKDPEYGINQIKCFLSTKFQYHSDEVFEAPPEVSGSKFIEEMLNHACKIITLFPKDNKVFWETTFANLINHSCIPNVQVAQVDGKLMIYAIRPISSGEQIFRSYDFPEIDLTKLTHPIMEYNYLEVPLVVRRVFFEVVFGVVCDCRACKDDLNLQKCKVFDETAVDLLDFDTELALASKSLKHVIAQWKFNNDFITKFHKNLLSLDVRVAQECNKKLLEQIIHVSSFPF